MGGPKWGGVGRDPSKTAAWRAEYKVSGRSARAAWLYRLRRVYGTTEAEYEAQLALQGGRCAICGREFDPGQRPATDHNHETGKFRGILCHSCNWILGYAHDDPATLASAIEYLLRTP